MFRLATRAAVIFVSLVLVACAPAVDNTTPAPDTAVTTSPATILGSGIEQQYFAADISPGDDFYQHVNGTWLTTTAIPADKSNYGSFTVLDDEAQENLRTIIETAADADNAIGSDSQKVGDFFRSFLDESTLETLGAEPLQAALTQISNLSNKQDLLVLSAELNRIGVQMPTGFYISNDEKQSDQYITYLAQSGLGLPDRDWYLELDNTTYQQARTAYNAYINKVMTLAGSARADQIAASVMAIENQIATAHWDKVQNRQADLLYNKRSLNELVSMAPAIDWAAFMQALGVDETSYVVQQPSFIEAFNTIWDTTELSAWQDYFSFKLVDAFAAYMSDAFVQAQFDFEGRVLNGQQELEPRWKRGVGSVDAALGEVVGKIYVENYFQETSKIRMDQLVENLRAAFKVGIQELAWMTPATKEQAQDKLAKFNTKIGYPDSWKDYAALSVDASDLVGNVMRSRRVEHERELKKLGQPINRDEWFMTPYTVNAYYNPPMNEVVFPAAILQPPFFNVAADDAVNYGAIGAVIGHEFSHGFDDQGRKYDGDGNLRDWWTEADATAFSERANQLAAQYNQFEVLPGKFLNGEFTLGENIGDLSGLAVAYKAYLLSLNGAQAPVLDGFTGEQRFFIGWAQVWRRLYRDENLQLRISTDPHSHSAARTNGVLRNFDAWYTAFDVQPDALMYIPPEQRVKLW